MGQDLRHKRGHKKMHHPCHMLCESSHAHDAAQFSSVNGCRMRKSRNHLREWGCCSSAADEASYSSCRQSSSQLSGSCANQLQTGPSL